MDKPTRFTPALVGPFGPPQLACLRSWKAHGWDSIFIHIGEPSRPPWITSLTTHYLHVPPALDKQVQADLVCAYLNQCPASGITCVSYDTADWLYVLRQRLPAALEFWFPKPAKLKQLRSKVYQTGVAKQVGLPVLSTYVLTKRGPIDIELSDYPVALRPGNEKLVHPHFKMRLAKNHEEISRLLHALVNADSALIAQPFVNGPNLVVHGARAKDGSYVMDHLGFLVRRKYQGVSLTVEPIAIDSALERGCRRFVDEMKLVGVYHLDFLLDERMRNTYFLEINGRLGGTTNKVFTCGYDEPAFLVAAWHDKALRPAINVSVGARTICANKRAVLYALLDCVGGKLTPFDYPNTRKLRRLCELGAGLLKWRGEVYGSGSLRSSIIYSLHSIRGLLVSGRRRFVSRLRRE